MFIPISVPSISPWIQQARSISWSTPVASSSVPCFDIPPDLRQAKLGRVTGLLGSYFWKGQVEMMGMLKFLFSYCNYL